MKHFLLLIGFLFLLTSLQAQSDKLRGEWVLEKVEEVRENDKGKKTYTLVTQDYLASLSPKGKVSKFRYKFGGDREKSYAYSSAQLAFMGRQQEIKYSIRESVLHITNDEGSNAMPIVIDTLD